MRVHTIPLLLAGLTLGWTAWPANPPSGRCPGDPCGTAVIIGRAGPSSLFPPAARVAGDHVVGDQVFLKLADLGLGMNTVGDNGFVPRLATSWQFVSPTTITFRLNPRARWHDGQPVTARDVVFTFEVYRDTLVNSAARAQLREIADVAAPDDHTVTIRFRRTYPEQFYDATHHVKIIPRHLMDSIPRGRLAQHRLSRAPIGAGPYRFVSWREGESLELAADSAFFLGAPGIARLIFRIVPDFTTAITQLLAGDADFIDFLGTPENADRVATGREVRTFEYPSVGYTYLDLNLWNPDDLTKGHPLFAEREARRAIAQAINRRRVVATAYGRYGLPGVGPMSPSLPLGRDTTIPQLPYDTAAARATLARLGWRDSDGDGVLDRNGQRFEIEIVLPTTSLPRQRAYVEIASELKRVGIAVRQKPVDFPVMEQLNTRRQFHAALTTWQDDPSPASLRQTYGTGGIGTSNFRGYSNLQVDSLFERALVESDPVRARALWREAMVILNQDVPSIWLAAPIQFGAIHRRFQNVTFRPDVWSATLWTWRVTPGQALPRDLVR